MQRSVSTDLVIDVPPERVFEAWTDPQEIVKWWGDDAYYRMAGGEIDARVGGKWSVSGIFHKSQTPFTISGEYLRVEAPKTLLFTWNQSWMDGVTTGVEFLLMGISGSTLIKVRHIGDTNDELAEGHRTGWELVLGWMKSYLESAKPVPS